MQTPGIGLITHAFSMKLSVNTVNSCTFNDTAGTDHVLTKLMNRGLRGTRPFNNTEQKT